MGQDYSYSQPSSSDDFDITSLLEAEAAMYADEGESSYNAAEPFKYSPPEPRVADDGIPMPCCGGGGDLVVATSEMSDFQRQLTELKDEGHVNASKLDKLERTVGELSKKEVEVIHGFALEVYVMVYGLVLIGLAVMYLHGRA
uniref:Uncharacterized protein n=1 Tax=Brassica campestris TaxID=3711 RepID=M4CMZ8_BRACM